MPIEISIPNMTIKLNSFPSTRSTKRANRYENGIAIPTSIDVLKPKAAKTTIMTSAIEVRTFPCNSEIIWRANSESSRTKLTSTPSGKLLISSSTISLISVTVSMIFVPIRFFTSTDKDCCPLILEYPPLSLKVRLTSATSLRVTTELPDTLIGRVSISSRLENTLGTLTANLPDPVSWKPAGITLLLFDTA